MKIVSRPADNTKTVILIVSVIFVFGFLIWRVVGALNGSAPPAPAGDGTIGTTGPQEHLDSGPPISMPDSDATIAVQRFPIGSTMSPFRKDDEGNYVPTVDLQSTGERTFHPKTITKPIKTEVIIPEVRPDPEPITIMGVVAGQSPVAVIQVGDKEYVVNKGDRFGRGLILKSVSTSQVIIQDGKDLHYMRVGAHPTSPPAPKALAPTTPPIKQVALSGDILPR